jgi:hypothetical protein
LGMPARSACASMANGWRAICVMRFVDTEIIALYDK